MQAADLDHVCTDLEPELSKGKGLCKALPGCEGHLQNDLVLLVSQHCILGHVNLDLAHSDQPVFVMPMLSGGLNLEDILLHTLADVKLCS